MKDFKEIVKMLTQFKELKNIDMILTCALRDPVRFMIKWTELLKQMNEIKLNRFLIDKISKLDSTLVINCFQPNLYPKTISEQVFCCCDLVSEQNIALSEMQYGDFWMRDKSRKINIIMLHWDCCFSSSQTARVLFKRSLVSTDVLLDRDGKFYLSAPSENFSFAHGNCANKYSIGIEVCNPVDLQFIKRMENLWFQKINIIEEVLPRNGKKRYIDFSSEQYASLLKAIKQYKDLNGFKKVEVIVDIKNKIEVMVNQDMINMQKDQETLYIIGHYHVNVNKVDPGFNLLRVLKNSLPRGN